MAICNNKKCSLGECDQAETCTAYVPVITRADKIRAMSDEELADLINREIGCCTPTGDEEITEFVCGNGINTLCDIICGGECNAIASFKKSGDEACKEIVMKWLKQSAEEGEQ